MNLVANITKAVYYDEFPEDELTLKTFLFDRCSSPEDCSHLLGLYNDIIHVYHNYNEDVFIKAVEEHALLDYILYTYNQPSYYFNWFKKYMLER